MPIVHSGSQATIKPDVYDVLRGKINLAETPIYNQMPKGPDSPDANLFHYGFDAEDNPDNGGSADGTEFVAADAETYGSRANMYGRMQHYNKKFGVGEVAQGNQAFNTGGRDEYTYQMEMGLSKALKSAEYTLVGGQESQAGSNSVAHRTRGFEKHLVDTAGIAVQTDTATQVPAAFRMVSGALKTLTVTSGDYPLSEDDINDPFGAIWDVMKGHINLDVFGTRVFQRKVSKMSLLVPTVTDMTVVRRFDNMASQQKISTIVKTYEGDCGTARFHLHPWLRHDPGTQLSEAIGLDFRYGCLRMRQAPKVEKLDKTSAAKKGMIIHTYGLQYVPKVSARWKRSA
jgi:hypothetical protein